MLTRLDCSQTANHSLHLRPLSLLKFASTARNCGPRSVQRHCFCLVYPHHSLLLVLSAGWLRAWCCKLTFVRDEAEEKIQRSLRRCAVRLVGSIVAVWRLASSPVHNGVVGWSRTAAVVPAAQTASAVQGLQLRLLALAQQFVSNHRPAVRQSRERRRQSGCDQ